MKSFVAICLFSHLTFLVAGQAKWTQCGGQGWTGATTCSDPGWTCQVQNQYYSQCLQSPGGGGSSQDYGQNPSPSPAAGGGSQGSGQYSSPSQAAGVGSQGSGQYSAPSPVANQGTGSQNSGQNAAGSPAAAANSPASKPGSGRKCRPQYNGGSNNGPSSNNAASSNNSPGSNNALGSNTRPVNNNGPGSNSGSGSNSAPIPSPSAAGGSSSPSTGGTSSSPSSGNEGSSGANNTESGGSPGSFSYLPSKEIQPYSGGGGGSAKADNLATTTNYGPVGDNPGACGCSGTWQNGNAQITTAAPSAGVYGEGYCGAGCGTCFKLTNTGTPPCSDDACGIDSSHKGETVMIMATNSCPAQGNEQWCTSPNKFGYKAHFDLAVAPPGWGNVVVSFEPAACPQTLVQPYGQCKCASQRPVKGGY